MEPTWYSEDLPVLEATVELIDHHAGKQAITVGMVAERLGTDAETVWASLRRLKGEYVQVTVLLTGGNPNPYLISGVTPAARRAVGQWPSADVLADRLVSALEAAAQKATDEVQRSKLKAVSDAMAGLGKEVLVQLITRVATGGHL